MTQREKFLNTYKDYETLVRASGLDPKEIEDELAGSGNVDGDRLRMCRLFRNYFSHVNDLAFLEPTAKMMSFLEKKVRVLQEKGDVVKKHLRKPDVAMCMESEKCGIVSERVRGLKCLWIPVMYSDGGIGVLDAFAFLGQKSSQKVGLLGGSTKPVKFCKPVDEYAGLDRDAVWVCTDDGTKNGKILGRVWFKDSQN